MIRNLFILLEMIKERMWGDRGATKEKLSVYFNIDLGEGHSIFGKIFKLCIWLESLNKCHVESQENE